MTFKNLDEESNFKKFTCKNKETILVFLSFGNSFKNPITKAIFKALAIVVQGICSK